MTIEETKKIMAYIAAAYPRYFANVTRESAERQAIPWYDALGEYSSSAVMAGVKGYISADGSGFPPTPGQIVHYIHFTGHPADHSGTEAWALVRKAVNCPWDQMEASFYTLPETVQKAVGNAASLKELAQMDMQKFETVAQSNFLRMYEAVQRREATEQRISNSVIGVKNHIRQELEMRRPKEKQPAIPVKPETVRLKDEAVPSEQELPKTSHREDRVDPPVDRLAALRRRLGGTT